MRLIAPCRLARISAGGVVCGVALGVLVGEALCAESVAEGLGLTNHEG